MTCISGDHLPGLLHAACVYSGGLLKLDIQYALHVLAWAQHYPTTLLPCQLAAHSKANCCIIHSITSFYPLFQFRVAWSVFHIPLPHTMPCSTNSSSSLLQHNFQLTVTKLSLWKMESWYCLKKLYFTTNCATAWLLVIQDGLFSCLVDIGVAWQCQGLITPSLKTKLLHPVQIFRVWSPSSA